MIMDHEPTAFNGILGAIAAVVAVGRLVIKPF